MNIINLSDFELRKKLAETLGLADMNNFSLDDLVEVHKIVLLYFGAEGVKYENIIHPWEAQIGGDDHYIDQIPGDAMPGKTALEAAMRCLLEFKLRSHDA